MHKYPQSNHRTHPLKSFSNYLISFITFFRKKKKKKEREKYENDDMQKKPQEHRNNSKIRGRELSGTGASSRRAWNEQQNGGRGEGVVGWLVFEGGAERYRKENRAMSQPPNQAADC